MFWLAMLVAIAGCSDAPEAGENTPSTTVSEPTPTIARTTSTETTTATTGSEQANSEAEEDGSESDETAVVVLAGGLTPEFAATIDALELTEASTTIQVGRVQLVSSADSTGQTVDELEAGFVIQLDARAYSDLETAFDFAPDLVSALGELDEQQVILSESSAALRRLDEGATMTLDNGAQLEVGRILPDAVVGSSEVVLVGPDALSSAGSASPRSVALVDYRGTGTQLEQVLLAENDGEGVRVFGGRGGDDQRDRDRAVLAQIRVKEIFGEFAFRPRGGGAVEIDQAWVEANIVTADLPLLGQARCHRLYAPILTEVLQGLIDDGLSEVIDAAAFQGCWNPRFIGGSDRLSRHAWGIAADINFFNPLDDGPGSPVHPELLDRMMAAGITSGHNWSSPDPGHFEYIGGLEEQ